MKLSNPLLIPSLHVVITTSTDSEFHSLVTLVVIYCIHIMGGAKLGPIPLMFLHLMLPNHTSVPLGIISLTF